MERKINEVFETSNGTKLKVVSTNSDNGFVFGCDGCFYDNVPICESFDLIGFCGFEDRSDNQDVIFKEVTE